MIDGVEMRCLPIATKRLRQEQRLAIPEGVDKGWRGAFQAYPMIFLSNCTIPLIKRSEEGEVKAKK